MAQLQLTGVTSSLRVLVTSATPPSYKLDLTGSLAWNNSANYCLFRAGNAVVGRHPSWGDYASFYHAATTNTGGTTSNYCLMHGRDGSTYLNASSTKLMYFVHAGGNYTVTIGAMGLGIGKRTTAAAYPLEVTGSSVFATLAAAKVSVGATPGTGKFLVNSGGTSNIFLTVANSLGTNDTNTGNFTLRGWVAIDIGSSVITGITGTHYIPVYSKA